VDVLEQAGLVFVDRSGGRAEVMVSHPMYGEVLRERIPRLRARAMYRQLADELERSAEPHPGAAIQQALWRLGQGGAVSPEALLAASDAVRGSVAIAHLDHMNAAIAAGPEPLASVISDITWRPGIGEPSLGLRLAHQAWERGRGSDTGFALVR